MDLFSAASSFGLSSGTMAMLHQQRHVFQSQLSDSTRNTLMSLQQQHEMLNPVLSEQQKEMVRSKQRNVLDPYRIEHCGNPVMLQTTNEATGGYVLSHPVLDDMHRLGQIEGYGITHNAERAEILRSRVLTGSTEFVRKDGKMDMTFYADTANIQGYKQLSKVERESIKANWQMALDMVFEDELDPTSPYSAGF